MYVCKKKREREREREKPLLATTRSVISRRPQPGTNKVKYWFLTSFYHLGIIRNYFMPAVFSFSRHVLTEKRREGGRCCFSSVFPGFQSFIQSAKKNRFGAHQETSKARDYVCSSS